MASYTDILSKEKVEKELFHFKESCDIILTEGVPNKIRKPYEFDGDNEYDVGTD
jgi:hypothetical protein